MCVNANVNILSMYGKRIPYNTCRNAEWQICAAKGMLPGQGGQWKIQDLVREDANIRFAFAPKHLTPFSGEKPLGSCGGYKPAGCGTKGYASSDIFYMEVCILDQICDNRDEMWALDVGDDWICDIDPGGYQQLRDWVLDARETRAFPPAFNSTRSTRTEI